MRNYLILRSMYGLNFYYVSNDFTKPNLMLKLNMFCCKNYLVLNLFYLLHDSLHTVPCCGNKNRHRERHWNGDQNRIRGIVHGAWCRHMHRYGDGNEGWVCIPLGLGFLWHTHWFAGYSLENVIVYLSIWFVSKKDDK